MSLSNEVLERLADDAVLSPNDAPRYPGDTVSKARRKFIKYFFLFSDTMERADGWYETPISALYGGKNDMVLYASPIAPPQGKPDGNWWKMRVYDESVHGENPLSVVYFNMDDGEFTGENAAAKKDHVNWLNFLPNDAWIYRLGREWNYGRDFTWPDGSVGPYHRTIVWRDGSWNANRRGADYGPAWGIMLPLDPRMQVT